MGEEDTDWRKAHLIGRESGGGRHRLVESALESGRGWGRKTPTGGERTLEWEGVGILLDCNILFSIVFVVVKLLHARLILR